MKKGFFGQTLDKIDGHWQIGVLVIGSMRLQGTELVEARGVVSVAFAGAEAANKLLAASAVTLVKIVNFVLIIISLLEQKPCHLYYYCKYAFYALNLHSVCQ
jgi:hypothetical protein